MNILFLDFVKQVVFEKCFKKTYYGYKVDMSKTNVPQRYSKEMQY